jgi:transposase
VIGVNTWAEVRRLHADGVPKKEIARRLGINVKTVRKFLQQSAWTAQRAASKRPSKFDIVHDKIVAWLIDEPRLTAKRIATLIAKEIGPVSERRVRQVVAEIRRELRPPEAFVHRTHEAGHTMEVDFGEAWAQIDGALTKVHCLVATLPFSNAYFARAYRVERLECLMDGVLAALDYFGGLPRRLVLDNTGLAVQLVLKGRERKEQTAFVAFRGQLGLAVDYCAPAKGNEKGSVERGVGYVKNNCFRPTPKVASLDELNAVMLAELERDLPRRPHRECGSAAAALAMEQTALKPLPSHLPQPCRIVAAKVDKYGHVRVDGVEYSVPTRFVRRTATVKLFAETVQIAVDDAAVATHRRAFVSGEMVLDLDHSLELLRRKSRAISEATVIRSLNLPAVFSQLHTALRMEARHADREWLDIVSLLRECSREMLTATVEMALQAGSPRLATIRQLLRHQQSPVVIVEPVPLDRADLAAITVREPNLAAYDELLDRREEVA